MAEEIVRGDAVVPANNHSHPVMTVYDLTGKEFSTAECNWLVGHEMRKARYLVSALVKVRRTTDRRRA